MKITFYGYNAFVVENGSRKIAIDPGALFLHYFRLTPLIPKKEWKGLKPDVLMIPIGGRVVKNTMGEEEALEAVKIISPKKVIPCHYDCDALWIRKPNPADDEMFKREVEKLGIECIIMKGGDGIII